MVKKTLIMVILLKFSLFAKVDDLGTYGETFAISEISIIDYIGAKLKILNDSNELAKHQKTITDRMVKNAKNPKAVEGIIKADKNYRSLYDPSITTNKDIKDHKGRIIAAANTKVSPLKMVSLSNPVAFFDGTDGAQIKWAKAIFKKYPNAKLILIKGSPFDEKLQKTIANGQNEPTLFFDQGGAITTKLGILFSPTLVTQGVGDEAEMLVLEAFKL